MTNVKSTRHALLLSAVALLLCFAMLLGTTFAWFTDSAASGTNMIQAGNLKIDIVDVNGTSLVGDNLKFQNKNGETDILWEPGVTFRTQAFQIKNNGNLALKYRLSLNGVTGNAKLLEVITFSIVDANGNAVDLANFEGTLNTANALSEAYYIQGVMATSAGNEYQGLTLEGVGVTVSAAQLTYETDSFDDQYDKNAEFGEFEVVSDNSGLANALNSGETNIMLESGEYSIPSLVGKEGITIVGTNDTVAGGDNAETGFTGNFGKNNTIKNITFSGTSNGVRWSYAQGGTTVFENCAFVGDGRGGFHIDQSNGATLIFINCTFAGFNAFASDLEKVIFDGCTMQNNGKYNGLNMYCDAELNNCTFEFTGIGSEFVDYEAAGKTLTINNCTATLNGASYDLTQKIGGTYVSQTTITIDGVPFVK